MKSTSLRCFCTRPDPHYITEWNTVLSPRSPVSYMGSFRLLIWLSYFKMGEDLVRLHTISREFNRVSVDDSRSHEVSHVQRDRI